MVDEVTELKVVADWTEPFAEPVIVLTAEQVTNLMRQNKLAHRVLPLNDGDHLEFRFVWW